MTIEMKKHEVTYSWMGQYSNKVDCKLVFSATIGIPVEDFCKQAVPETTLRNLIDAAATAQGLATNWRFGYPHPWRTAWAYEARGLAWALERAVRMLSNVPVVAIEWNLTHRPDDFIIDVRHQERMKANAG